MVLRHIFMTVVWPIFFIILPSRDLMSIKFHEAYITTRNNDPVAFNLAAFNGK